MLSVITHGLVIDPTAGGGTTLIAARLEGRRAMGAEVKPDSYAKALARCADLPVETPTGRQRCLFQ
jgi:DNA modification methylase